MYRDQAPGLARQCCAVSDGDGNFNGDDDGDGGQQQQQPHQWGGRGGRDVSSSTSAVPINNTNSSSGSPDADITMDEMTDAQLARELNALTVEEREQVFDDIHGVAKPVEEGPEFVATLSQQLDTALSKVAKPKRKEWDRAIFLKPTIKTDVAFKMMFLRVEHYDVKKAANRIAKYFTQKLELFGEDMLVRSITLEDLDDKCMKILKSGSMLELPNPDRAGRTTMYFDLGNFEWSDSDTMFRCFWYFAMATLENHVAQTKGVSLVAFLPTGPSESMMPHLRKILERAGKIQCMPLRKASTHLCIKSEIEQEQDASSSWIPTFISWARYSIRKQGRLRLRIHFGSSVETKYSLLTFGIDCGNALDDDDKHGDDGKAQLVQQYLNRRIETERLAKEAAEREEAESGIVLFPKPNDVLLGRGRPFRDFSGNKRWGLLVEENVGIYMQSESKFAKTCLSLNLVKTVQEYGGRFLRRTEGGWKVMDDDVARDKTIRAFRPRLLNGKAGDDDEADEKKGRAKRMKHA